MTKLFVSALPTRGVGAAFTKPEPWNGCSRVGAGAPAVTHPPAPVAQGPLLQA